MKYFKVNYTGNQKGVNVESHVEVTKRVESGMTEFFSKKLKNSQQRASNFATRKKTYMYSIFGYVNKSGREQFEFIGFGVPK